MTASFQVTFVNLAPDARSASADLHKDERRGVSAYELRSLLRNFCELDPVENATAEPEIRVHAAGQSMLFRMAQRKLILYDMLNREIPGHVVTVDEAMAELDGSASAARAAAQLAKSLVNATAAVHERPVATPPVVPRASRPRMIVLGIVAALLLAAIGYLRFAARIDRTPAGFAAVPRAETADLQNACAGVYVTGTSPGQHGIVLTAAGDLRLFEFRALDAPRVVHARGEWGRIGGTLCLATDQPGGLITMPARDSWVYCGETYTRVP